MRRWLAASATLAVGVVAVGGSTAGGTVPPAPTPAPGGILVSVSPSRCYTPDAKIRVAVENLMPGSSVQVNSEETVSVNAIASSAGTATLRLSAPSGLPRRRVIEAHLLTVVGTDATGRITSEEAAFLLAKRSVCKRIGSIHHG